MNAGSSRFLILLGTLMLLGPSYVEAQVGPADCSKIKDEHFNQIDPKPLRVSGIHGVAIDETDVKLGNGCVVVFSADHSRLVASATIQPDGSFVIPKLPNGNYVLIVASQGFCPANNAIRVRSGIRAKHRLVARMKVRAVDVCSWIEAK